MRAAHSFNIRRHIFRPYEATDYEALKWSIERFGQQQPILVYGGMVLDGWHRYRACVELGLPAVMDELVCDDHDVFRYILEHLLKTRPVSKEARSVAQAVLRDPDHIARHGGRRRAGMTFGSTLKKRAAAAGVGQSTQRKVEHIADCCPDLLWDIVQGALRPDAAYQQCAGEVETAETKDCRCDRCMHPSCAVRARVRDLEQRLRRAGLSSD